MKRYFYQLAGCLILFASLGISSTIQAQDIIRCFTDEKMEAAQKADPEYERLLHSEHRYDHSVTPPNRVNIVTIPVHVIIVHAPGQAVGTGNNLSLAHIQSQIAVLNEDFRRLNADAVNTPPVFSAVDSEIEFCLATKDPNGNPTDGVTRHGTNQNLNSNEFSIKQATGWPRDQYLNMWVGPNLGGILGWAYLPSPGGLPNPTLDGVVVATGTFGGPGYGTAAPYDLGRTATHEVGHYLGLRHVWGSGGCGNDDNMPDTPIQANSNFGCPTHPSPSCNNGGDMFMNYMDYVNDNCMNAFTQDQADYMNLILTTSRSSIPASGAINCSLSVPLTVAITSQTDVSCAGAADGTATVLASGGDGNYLYSVDNGPFLPNPTITGLSGGLHTIIVQDGLGNIISIDVVIQEPAPIITQVIQQVNISCFGGQNGMITVSASGGQPGSGTPYLYSIDGGGFTPFNTFQDLTAGLHLITVQDGNGCLQTTNALLTSPPQLILEIDSLANAGCPGDSTGFVGLQGGGGTPNYVFAMNGGPFVQENNFTDLGPGDYLFTIRDENNCTVAIAIEIEAPDSLALDIIEQQDVVCAGDSSGMLIVEAMGGTAEYEFSLNDIDYQNDPTFEDLAAGIYPVFARDANGCLAIDSIELTEPDTLLLDVSEQNDISCFGDSTGMVVLEASGGAGPLEYFIAGNMDTQTNGVFDQLMAGDYQFIVRDTNTCEQSISINLTQNDSLAVEVAIEIPIDCGDSPTGAVSLAANGGTGPLSFSMDGGPLGPDVYFDDLAAGTHDFLVQDSIGCQIEGDFILEDPDGILVTGMEVADPSCFDTADGSLLLEAEGGTGMLTYTLDGQSNTDGQFFDLPAGEYEVTIADANNCLTVIEAIVEQPEAIELILEDSQAPTCADDTNGSLFVEASGGAGNYSYTLDGTTNMEGQFDDLAPGTYTLTVEDQEACVQEAEFEVPATTPVEIAELEVIGIGCSGAESGSVEALAGGGNGDFIYTLNGESNATGLFNDLPSGSFTLLVEDALGCATEEVIDIEEGEDLLVDFMETVVIPCSGSNGSVQLEATGGDGTFNFTVGNETNTDGLFELPAGTYEAEIADGSGCSATIDFTLEEPDALELEVVAVSPLDCFSDSTAVLEVTGIGGTGPYTFQLPGHPANNTGIFEELPANSYEVLITDDNGCQSYTAISITQPDPLILSGEVLALPNCTEGELGVVQLQSNGGTAPYTFELNGLENTTGLFEELEAGNYSVLVTDDSGCITETDLDIELEGALQVEATEIEMVACFGKETGSVQLDASGGFGPLTFFLNGTPNAGGFFDNLESGLYQFTASDGGNCFGELNVEIEQPDAISFFPEFLAEINCQGDENAAIQVEVSGGVEPYEYILGAATNQTGLFEQLAADSYLLSIVDANGCQETQILDISEPDALEISSNQENVSCFGLNDGSLELEASGGQPPYTFVLDGQSNATGLFFDLPAGDYPAHIEDANGCQTSTTNLSLTQPDSITINILDQTSVSCFEEADGRIEVFASGGHGDFTYFLEGQSNSSGIFEDLPAGIYTIEVVDGQNCDNEIDIMISEPSVLIGEILDVQEDMGNNDGSITVEAEGGTEPYEYFLDNGSPQTNGVFTNLPGGDYLVAVVDANDCSWEILVTIGLINSVGEIDGSNSIFQIRPNPFSTEVWLDMELPVSETLHLTIYNAQGIRLAVVRENFAAGNHQWSLPIQTNWPSGTYFVEIRTEQEVSVERLIKGR